MKTIIKVSCQDQVLKLIDEPVIASGGVHENFIQFEFCEKWAGMTKTAVFYNNPKKITPYHTVVDSSGMCEVPCEVTEKQGTMYFGVFGVLGDVTRTSCIIAYKVKEGSITTELVPSEPTPDIWEQLLTQCSELLTIVEGSKQEQEQFMMDVENAQEAFKQETKAAQTAFEEVVNQGQQEFMESVHNDQEQFKQDTQDIIETIPGFVDIKTTTGTELKSSAGPLNFISMNGKTAQNTTSSKNLLPSLGLTTTVINNSQFKPEYGSNGELKYINISSAGPSVDTEFWIAQNFTLDAGAYYLNGATGGNSNLTLRIYLKMADGTSGYLDDTGNGKAFSVPDGASVEGVCIFLRKGKDASNIKFCPMITSSSETDKSYEPYRPNSPSPEFPQSIHNVGDCVDMMQGYYGVNNGNYTSHATTVCNKNKIPCASGDAIKVAYETSAQTIAIIYYNDNGYLVGKFGSNTNAFEDVAPSGATYFNFYIDNGVESATVGKISLTINGKYVVQIATNYGVEMMQGGWNATSGHLPNVATCVCNKTQVHCKTGDVVNIKCAKASSINLLLYNENTFVSTLPMSTSGVTIPSGVTNFKFNINSASDITPDTVGKITITINGVGEKVATVLLNEPLRDGDVMSRTEVVRKRATKKASELSWGASTNNPHLFVTASFTSDCICTHFTDVKDSRINGDYYANMYLASGQCSKRHGTVDRVYFKLDSVSTLEEWKAWIAENDFLIEFDLPEEVIEALDEASQLALQSFEAFDTATHITIDSRVQPNEIKFEHGTTKVGAMALAHDKVIHEKADKYCIELPEGTDFNDVFDAGKYYVSYKPNFENKPLKNISGYLDVIARKMATGVYYQQIFTTEDKGVTLRRYYIKAASVWSAWTVLNDRVTEYRFLADGGVKNLFDNNWYPGGMYLVTISRPALAFRQVSIVFCDQDNNIHEHELVLYRGDAGKLDFFYDWDMDMVSIRPVDYGDGGLHDVYVSVLTLSRGDMNTLVYAESEE